MNVTITAWCGGESQRLHLFPGPWPQEHILEVGGERLTITVVSPAPPRAFAEVRLLDATGTTAEGLRKETWTYRNPEGLSPGEIVFVPFGIDDDLQIAKIMGVGPEGAYHGPGRIKTIDGRAISESECDTYE